MSACQQDYNIDNIDFTPRLVANSLFTAGSEIEVIVHSTRNVLDSDSNLNAIDDAEVTIKDANGIVLAILQSMGEGRYHTYIIELIVGETYTLNVSREGFTSIEATSTIPRQVDASLNSNIVTGETSESLNIDVQLMDNDLNDNYYVYEVVDSLQLHLNMEQPFKLESIQDIEILLTSENQDQEQISSNKILQSRIFLKDKNFANSSYNINFQAKSNPAAGPIILSTPEEVFSDQNMRVITASQHMYEYYKSVETFRIKGDANSSISQPIAIYSNVSNGLGIFAGYSKNEFPLL